MLAKYRILESEMGFRYSGCYSVTLGSHKVNGVEFLCACLHHSCPISSVGLLSDFIQVFITVLLVL